MLPTRHEAKSRSGISHMNNVKKILENRSGMSKGYILYNPSLGNLIQNQYDQSNKQQRQKALLYPLLPIDLQFKNIHQKWIPPKDPNLGVPVNPEHLEMSKKIAQNERFLNGYWRDSGLFFVLGLGHGRFGPINKNL